MDFPYVNSYQTLSWCTHHFCQILLISHLPYSLDSFNFLFACYVISEHQVSHVRFELQSKFFHELLVIHVYIPHKEQRETSLYFPSILNIGLWFTMVMICLFPDCITIPSACFKVVVANHFISFYLLFEMWGNIALTP